MDGDQSGAKEPSGRGEGRHMGRKGRPTGLRAWPEMRLHLSLALTEVGGLHGVVKVLGCPGRHAFWAS